MPGLGRIPSPVDVRDFALEAFLPAAPTWEHFWTALETLFGRGPAQIWPDADAVLDQGDYGTCVGNGCAQWGNTLPVDDRFTEADARKIYYEATCIDGQPDDPDAPGGGQQGSTVRSGAKALKNRKRLNAYAFTRSLTTMKTWLLTKGPLIVGTDWMNDMFNPDANGFVRPTGEIVGGHCYLLLGLDSSGHFVFLNSWGPGWGQNGRFKMTQADFMRLFQSNGECCAAVELP